MEGFRVQQSQSESFSIDSEYRFGRPKVYLTPHELARLTLVRSRLGDTRAEREVETPRPRRKPVSR